MLLSMEQADLFHGCIPSQNVTLSRHSVLVSHDYPSIQHRVWHKVSVQYYLGKEFRVESTFITITQVSYFLLHQMTKHEMHISQVLTLFLLSSYQ